MRTVETLLDRVLTVLFSPLALIGIRKCSRCTVRTRMAQFGRLVTWPLAWVPLVRRARLRWYLAANPEQRKLVRVS
jgi:hypothetical protein